MIRNRRDYIRIGFLFGIRKDWNFFSDRCFGEIIRAQREIKIVELDSLFLIKMIFF